ncbi:MAG: BON domain-containing protein [Alphaproteobacteria bacterium]|nr:BON domain-containing protein [Alphaproteobacteria bacterium]
MKKRVLLCSFFCIMLSGCQFVGTIYNAGHKITSLVLDDRSLKDDYTDTKINLAIRKNLAQRDIKYFLDIEITVFEGYVLLNGALPQTALIDEVNEIVWKTNGVQKVYNYIRLDTPPKITIVNEDAAISAKIRYELSITKGISSVNYKITMENGTIYLMGISENEEELKKVLAIIKNTVSVQKIVVLTRYKT